MNTTPTVATFRQYVDTKHRAAAARHNLPLTEVAQELPESIYTQEWRDYVVHAFTNGATIPTRLWRSLDDDLRHRVLHSPRALRDDALTHQLLAAILD